MHQGKYFLNSEVLRNDTNEYIKRLLYNMDCDSSAYNYIQYLNEILCMNKNIKKKLFNQLIGSDDNQCIAAIAELTFISLWKYLGMSFEFEPDINNHKPDFKITIDDDCFFIAEVTMLRSNHPHFDTMIIKYGDDIKIINQNTGEILDKLPPAAQPIEQHNKIIYEVDQKLTKYQHLISDNRLPFVICFYLPDFKDEFYISKFQIEKALFGEHTIIIKKNDPKYKEYYMRPYEFKGDYGIDYYTGIFCFEKYSNLTAVLFMNNEYINNKNCFCLRIYLNPLGYWNSGNDNPFTKKGLSVNYVDEQGNILIKEPNILSFY